MPKQYPTRASLHRSDVAVVVDPPSAPLAVDTDPAAPVTPVAAPAAPLAATPEPGPTPAPPRPPLMTRAERRRREQAALESTALMAPVSVDEPTDDPAAPAEPAVTAPAIRRRTALLPPGAPATAATDTAVAEPAPAALPAAPARRSAAESVKALSATSAPAAAAAPAAQPAAAPASQSAPATAQPAAPGCSTPRPQWAPVRPAHPAGSAFHAPAPSAPAPPGLPTRAELRRLELAAELAALPEPVLPSHHAAAPAGADLSRAARREAEHATRQRRKADRQRAAQPASLAAVAGALIVATVVVDPVAVATSQIPVDEDHRLVADGALENRGSAASRAGEREALDDAEPTATEAVTVTKAEAVASASDALDRTATVVSTEGRTTAEQREEIVAQAALVRELSNRLAIGDSPAPADPELIDVVNATLMSTAVDAGLAPAPESTDPGESTGGDVDAQDVVGESGADATGANLGADEQPDAQAADTASVNLDDPGLVAKALTAATARLEELLETATPAAVTVAPREMTAAEVLEHQIAEAQAYAASLGEAYADSVAHFENGRIPTSAMAELSWAPGHFLRRDAAAQLERLNIAYRAEFGVDLSITDSYRSFEGQVRARATRGRMAAVPGTSNHGWGVAVDLGGGINRFGTAQHRWLREHAEDFGWTLPGWARENGAKPEPWHWEFEGAPEVGAD